MITRKYTYLAGEDELKKVEIPIYNEKSIGIVYVKNKGYGLYNDVKTIESSLFILSTNITPSDFDKNPNDKQQFIQLVTANLAEIYKDAEELKEYEKKHPEYIFIQLMDLLKTEPETLNSEDELYKIVTDGFEKLDIDMLKSLAQ